MPQQLECIIMAWPVAVKFYTSKVVRDIESISRFDQKWFDSLVNEGYNPPTSSEIIFPQGYWWYWGN